MSVNMLQYALIIKRNIKLFSFITVTAKLKAYTLAIDLSELPSVKLVPTYTAV